MIPLLLESGVVIPSSDVWYWLMSAIGFPVMIIAAIGIAVAWTIVNWRIPQESKQITKATHGKRPVIFFFNDAGQGWFEPLKQINASGAASTTKNIDKPKGFLGFFPRKKDPVFQNPTQDVTGDIAADNLAEYVDSLQTSKIYLRNAKIPIHVAYTGKALITSFMALAGVEVAQKLTLTDGGQVIEECPYCGQKQQPYKILLQKIEVTIINISRFFKNIGKLTAWDESQKLGIAIEQLEKGRDIEKRATTRNPLLLLLLAMGFCFGMAVLLVVVAFILK